MKRIILAAVFAVTACGPEEQDPFGHLSPSDEVLDETTEALAALKVFNPKDYAGYDPTGASESSAAFGAAIDAAAAYAAAHPTGADLFVPPQLVNAPQQRQAIVRVDRGVFKLESVFMKSNVRLEINAGALIIPPRQEQTVVFQVADLPSQGGNNGTVYLHDWTITSWGTSMTFPDTGGRTRTKSTKYAVTFPDGSALRLDNKFTMDMDPVRWGGAGYQPGHGPRFSGIKVRQAQRFFISNYLELASDGNAGVAPNGPAQGSNSYPSTAGAGISMQAALTGEWTEGAVQPRNGTVRHIHCEGCTRGYGITEIHSGVDIDWSYVSTRGGQAIRWESADSGQSTRQTAQQVVGYDGNSVFLFSNHGHKQRDLHARFAIAHGMDNGVRAEGTDGVALGNTASDIDVYSGPLAQVITKRDATDDYFWHAKSEEALKIDTTGLTLTNARCKGFTGADAAHCQGTAP